MRWLPPLVGIETAVLCVLFAVWWLRDPGIAPPIPGSNAAASDGAAAAAGGTVVAPVDQGPAASPAAPQRTAAPTPGDSAGLGIILHGRLVAPTPFADVEQVRLNCHQNATWRPAELHADGSYAVADLTPGLWRIRCEAPGFRRIDLEHTVTTAPIQRLDIPLQAATVLPVFVRTTDDRRLQPELAKLGIWQGLTVVATREPLVGDLEPTENSSVFSIGIGNHRQDSDLNRREDPEAGDGVLELDEPPPVHAALLLRHLVLARQRIEPGQTELRFQVDPTAVVGRLAKVRVRLLGPNGPLEKATVRLSTAQGGGRAGTTDAQGFAVVTNVLPGLTAVDIHAKDCEQLTTHWTIPPDGELDRGEIVLTGAVQVAGKVVDQAGKPVRASVQWTALDLWQAPHPRIDRRSTTADGDGHFTLPTGQRRYTVRAQTDDQRVGFAIVDAASAGPERFVVTVQPTQALHLRTASQQVRVGVVADRDGNLLDVRRLELRWPAASMSLPDGEYRLTVYDGHGRQLQQEALRIAGSEVTKELR